MPEIIVKLGDKVVHRYFFDKDVVSIGRARDNDIVVENLSVSRNHARIRRSDGKFILTDLNSANGTLVNSVRITKHEVCEGDVIQIGKHLLYFSERTSPAAESGAPVAAAPADNDDNLGPPGMIEVVKGRQAAQRFKVGKAETSIGRANDNDIRLHDWFVSKRHAVIVRRGKKFFLRDLQSWRGTTVNNQPVRAEIEIKNGDEIVTAGTTVLRFRDHIPPELELEIAAAAAIPADGMTGDHDSSGDLPPAEFRTVELDQNRVAQKGVERSAAATRDSIPIAEAAGTDDEFAPMTEDELASLESEGDSAVPHDQADLLARAEWENFEMEGMASMGERIEDHRPRFDTEDELAKEEEAGLKSPTDSNYDQTGGGFATRDLEAEEEALFADERARTAAAAQPKAPAPVAAAAMATADDGTPAIREGSNFGSGEHALLEKHLPRQELTSEERAQQIALWTKALGNKSRLIRKNAAYELKKLTGKDYDWESPTQGP
ncbi:MAG: FHA domain-containing protein [Candidatus Sumerlaeia bacterium]|nr:FHA domain-containing protein [Candidatus Sumerlaeia bacterium]